MIERYMYNEISTGIVVSAFAAFMSAFAGLFVTWINSKFRSAKARSDLAIENIAQISHESGADHQAATIGATVQSYIDKIDLGAHSARSNEEIKTVLKEIKDKIEITASSPLVEAAAVESLIAGYHEQALSQAKAQFIFSIMAATVGFAWILYAGTEINTSNIASAAKTLPGVVMDAVAYLFFKQASETRQRATDLYDRLRKDKQTTESIALVTSIEDARVRSAVKAQMALHMAGLAPSPINLTNFLSSPDHIQSPPLDPSTAKAQKRIDEAGN